MLIADLKLVVKRSALVFVCVAAAVTATACIFDEGGDYPGGGRRNIGADFGGGEQTEEAGTGEEEDKDSGSSPDPFADVFGGGGG